MTNASLPAPTNAPPPCPHCGTRVGTRPTQHPITRPKAYTFGGGWVTATVLVSLFSFLTLFWVVPLIWFIAKESKRNETEIIGAHLVDECVACHRPR